jgi:Short C-terminal domain
MNPNPSGRYEDMAPIARAMLPDQTRSEIERYKEMMNAGLITPEEFEQMRRKILQATGLLD